MSNRQEKKAQFKARLVAKRRSQPSYGAVNKTWNPWPQAALIFLQAHYKETCLRKVAYLSWRLALDQAISMGINPYFCYHCEHFHVGHGQKERAVYITKLAKRVYELGV